MTNGYSRFLFASLTTIFVFTYIIGLIIFTVSFPQLLSETTTTLSLHEHQDAPQTSQPSSSSSTIADCNKEKESHNNDPFSPTTIRAAKDTTSSSSSSSISSHDNAMLTFNVSFHGCCNIHTGEKFMVSTNGKPIENKAKNNPWIYTCLTENACHNMATTTMTTTTTKSFYPYTSWEEKELYQPYYTPENKQITHAEKCKSSNSQRIQYNKPQWCPHPPNTNGTASTTTTSSSSKDIINQFYSNRGCSIWSMSGGSGPFDRMLIFPKYKLALCGIPKVGITQWIQFLRFTLGAKDYLSYPHVKDDQNQFRFDLLKPSVQYSILDDDTWTKAIFIRNPIERILSAYLNKVGNIKGMKQFPHILNNPTNNHTITFETFITQILDFKNYFNISEHQCIAPMAPKKNETYMKYHGLGVDTWCTDPHWRPQTLSCGIQFGMLSKFQFVSTFDNDLIDVNTKTLLKEVGLWDTHGKYYHAIDESKQKIINRTAFAGGSRASSNPLVYPPILKDNEIPIGFQQQENNRRRRQISSISNTIGHNTNSKNKINEYYSSTDWTTTANNNNDDENNFLLNKVKELYKNDYDLYNAIKEIERANNIEKKKKRNNDDENEESRTIIHGKTIANKLQPEQCKL